MTENSADICIHQKWKIDLSQEITTITSGDMQASNGRIKNKIISTTTTMDKELGITHREVGIVIGTMDMIIR